MSRPLHSGLTGCKFSKSLYNVKVCLDNFSHIRLGHPGHKRKVRKETVAQPYRKLVILVPHNNHGYGSKITGIHTADFLPFAPYDPIEKPPGNFVCCTCVHRVKLIGSWHPQRGSVRCGRYCYERAFSKRYSESAIIKDVLEMPYVDVVLNNSCLHSKLI